MKPKEIIKRYVAGKISNKRLKNIIAKLTTEERQELKDECILNKCLIALTR